MTDHSGSRKKPLTALARQAAATKAASIARKKKRGEALIALIERRKARIVEDFYEVGEALRELLRDELYDALGYASFDAMLKERGVFGTSQAKKLIAVVERVPREDALRVGLEKSYALVAYAAATPEDDSAAALLADHAAIDGRPVSEVSVRELVEAAKSARPRKPLTPASRARAKVEREMLRIARSLVRDAPRAKLSIQGDEVVVRWTFRSLAKVPRR